MRFFNEAAAGEFASHQARNRADDRDAAKARALIALRQGRFADYDADASAYYDSGGMDDLEAWAANIVSAELADAPAALADARRGQMANAPKAPMPLPRCPQLANAPNPAMPLCGGCP